VATTSAAKPVVEVVGITKVFPGVVANDDVTIAFYPGEVHCLLGENGAGKSTLMNILSGMQRSDSGAIKVDGAEVEVDSPKRALDLGIGTVYQHATLIPVFSVLENLMLGMGSGVRLPVKKTLARLREICQTLGIEVDPEAVTGRLSLGQQQQIEIIRALWEGSRVLILDEPTSMLTPQGIAELEKLLGQLKSQGLAIIFITHKLREALDVGDRVSILRRSRLVGELDPEFVRSRGREEVQNRIVTLMFGAEASDLANVAEIRDGLKGRREKRDLASKPILEVRDLIVQAKRGEVGIHGVSLLVRAGEIMGVAGVDGNGQRELAEAISGQRRITGGDIRLDGTSIAHMSVGKRQGLGLTYVTDDRKGEGIVSQIDVANNLVLKKIGSKPFWKRGGRVCHEAIDACAEQLVEEFDIRCPSVKSACGTLSGGNLQKVLLARELAFDPRLVIFNKPTYGLDVKTTRAVRERIRRLAEDAGVAALLISTDLEELLDISDRMAVLYRGKVTGIVDNEVGCEERVGRLMIGASE
jgi:simple sugar transport system ATP-binding protein